MTIVCGIDPGAAGAVAFLDTETDTLLAVHPIPVDRVEVNGKTRSRVNRSALLELLRRAAGAHVFLERPEGRPLRGTNRKDGTTSLRQPGAAGMLSLGENYGCCLMACTAAEMRITEMRPSQWKSRLGVKAAKDDSRRRASELFPTWTATFTPKNSDGKAEAALVAYYGALALKGKT